jgi:hypothetical protein
MAIPKQLAASFSMPTLRQSTWTFCTSDGADLSISIPETKFGVVLSNVNLYVRNSGSSVVETLNFVGLGVGAGLQPIPVPGNFDFSLKNFPSFGDIYLGPCAPAQLSLNDFRGPCLVYQLTVQAGPGWGATFMFMGAKWVSAAVPPGPRAVAVIGSCRAVTVFEGASASVIPGAYGGYGAFGVCL